MIFVAPGAGSGDHSHSIVSYRAKYLMNSGISEVGNQVTVDHTVKT